MEIGTVASTFSAASASTPRSAYCCFARSYAACTCLSLMSAFQNETSEIKPIDVRLREHDRRPENDLAAADLNRAEAAGVERCRAGGYLVLRQERSREDGQVPQVARVPQDDGLDPAVVHVWFVHVRQRQADDIDVVA